MGIFVYLSVFPLSLSFHSLSVALSSWLDAKGHIFSFHCILGRKSDKICKGRWVRDIFSTRVKFFGKSVVRIVTGKGKGVFKFWKGTEGWKNICTLMPFSHTYFDKDILQMPLFWQMLNYICKPQCQIVFIMFYQNIVSRML